MAAVDVISPTMTSFVYEDLVAKIQTIQEHTIKMEKHLDQQWKSKKSIENQLKSRTLTIRDHAGYSTTHKQMDHEQMIKLAKSYKKNYIPKYLHEWTKFGLMEENSISPLTDLQLKSTISNFENDQEFVSYGEVIVWVGAFEEYWPRSIVVPVLFMDNMETVIMKIKEQRTFIDVELRSSTVEENTKPTRQNWLEGTPLKSDDTILSSQLFQKNAIIMAKISKKKVK